MTRTVLVALTLVFLPVLALAQPELTPPGPPLNALPPELPPNVLPEQPVEQEGVEALTKGPIHEAFADPAMPDPEPSPVVAKAPPADVPEQPAAYQPEGDFIWIPGYWSWDDDRDDFVWVTGVWRQPPPGMRWVPGYWQEASGGWQRVKGFWIPNETQDVVYYNQPPASLEVGPSSPAPAANYFWVPGSWTYASTNTGFNWQAGYWTPYQQNWVYVPARWIWSPAGYVYVPGYWDYRLGSRGQIFAPVYFRQPVYAQAGWFYRPSIVIPTSNLFIHLWMQPRYGSYYFGNYFGPQYANRGFVSWSNLPSQRHGYYYDPFYSYAHVHYRQQGIDYLDRVHGWHNYYAQHPEHRPPATFHEQRQWLRTPAAAAVDSDAQLVARPIGDVARQSDSPIKFTHLNEQSLQAQAEHAKQIGELNQQRRNLERQHVNLDVNRPPQNTNERRDNRREERPAGSLVDRMEKGEKGSQGTKGDQGEKRGPRATPGTETVAAAPIAKLSLPKVEMPKVADTTARTTTPAEQPKPEERRAAPPLPRADRTPKAGDRQNTSITPQNPIPDTGKSASRPTFGAKTGEQPRLPGRTDDPRLPGRDSRAQDGRNRGNEPTVPTGKTSGLPPGGPNPGLPGRELNASPGKTASPPQPRDRTIPPGGNQPSNTSQPNNSPARNIAPPAGGREPGESIPSLPPGKTTTTTPAGRDLNGQPSKTGPQLQPRERTAPQSLTPPNSQQGISAPHGNAPTFAPQTGGRERGGPRGDQPTFPGAGSKAGGGNLNQPPSQPQPQRGSSRQENSGSSSESKKKGKDKS